MPEYRIKDWDALFENHKTRILQRLDFVLLPNKMDGLGYTELISHRNGAAHFGAWVAMIEIASRQKPRGTLPSVRGNTAAALSRLSRIPEDIFAEVIDRLASSDIEWIEEILGQSTSGGNPALPGDNPALPGADPALNRREGNGIEEKRTESSSRRTTSAAPTQSNSPKDCDPEFLARETARKLHKSHPVLCNVSMAEAAACREMAKYAGQRPEAIASAWERTHAEHATLWRDQKQRDSRAYVPHLHVWFRDEMYLQNQIATAARASPGKADDLRAELELLRKEAANGPKRISA